MSIFKTRQEIALECGINRKTLDRHLKKANIMIESGRVSPKDYQRIKEYFGLNSLAVDATASCPKMPQNGTK